jgi:hypothetical protein
MVPDGRCGLEIKPLLDYCGEAGAKQIPFGNDRKKSKSENRSSAFGEG